jgi:hypothetical protein
VSRLPNEEKLLTECCVAVVVMCNGAHDMLSITPWQAARHTNARENKGLRLYRSRHLPTR